MKIANIGFAWGVRFWRGASPPKPHVGAEAACPGKEDARLAYGEGREEEKHAHAHRVHKQASTRSPKRAMKPKPHKAPAHKAHAQCFKKDQH